MNFGCSPKLIQIGDGLHRNFRVMLRAFMQEEKTFIFLQVIWNELLMHYKNM